MTEDPARMAKMIAATRRAGKQMLAKADQAQADAMLPRLRELLGEVDGATAMLVLVRHLVAWAVSVADEAQREGKTEQRDASLNMVPLLITELTAKAWAVCAQQGVVGAEPDPIGEPMGHA